MDLDRLWNGRAVAGTGLAAFCGPFREKAKRSKQGIR